MNGLSKFLLFSAAVLSFYACKEEEPFGQETTPKNVISFIVRGDEATTKAAAGATVMNPVDLSGDCGVDGLMLTETISSMDDGYFEETPVETKGTPVYTENFDFIKGYGAFNATAFGNPSGTDQLDKSKSWFGTGKHTFALEGGPGSGTYSYTYANGILWPENDGGLLYFLEAPIEATKNIASKFYSDGHIEFDYTVPKSSDGTKDAEAQPDILFTSKVMHESTKDTENHILFYHTLTAVKFKVGHAGDQIAKITKVEFKNIVGSGHCTVRPNYQDNVNTSASNPSNAEPRTNYSTTDPTKSYNCSTWDLSNGVKTDFTQTFASTVNEYTKQDGAGTVPDSFNYKQNPDGSLDKTDNTTLDNLNDGLFSQTFMFIPQCFGDNTTATVTVYYTLGQSSNTVYHRTISLKGVNWRAGEIHTYTLTINDVRVDISDELTDNGKTKYNITTKNTGNVTAYLRCALAANWVYDDPSTEVDENVIVSACDIFTTGKFYKTEAGGYGFKDNWVLGEDDYLYYIKPILPGQPTLFSLFERYVSPDATPYQDAHLEIGIALQGVQFDAAKTKVISAWNVDEVKVVAMSFDGSGNLTKTVTDNTVADVLLTDPEEL